MRNTNKGQAALEFLLTYGWAILGAMIAIGALSYFGIFNTQRYVNDVCYFGDQMICEDYIAYQNGTIGVQLRNNFGIEMDITNVLIKSDYNVTICDLAGISPSAVNIQPGTTFNINCQITTNTIPLNGKLKYKTIITFQRTGSGNIHNQTGDVMLTVQKVS